MIGGVNMYGAWFIVPLFCFGLWLIDKKSVNGTK